jgi:hypothetical protein
MKYPKLMLVSDNNISWHKRIVLFKNAKGYIAFTEYESIDDIDKCQSTSKWRFAKDIVEQKIVKLNENRNNSNINLRRLISDSPASCAIYNVEDIYS